MPEIEILSIKLRELRNELHKTQAEFAEEIGISEDEVSKIERKITDPKISTLQKNCSLHRRNGIRVTKTKL